MAINNAINNAAKFPSDSESTKAGVVLSKKSRFSKDSVGVPETLHQDEVLDEALEESFPASDPIAVSVSESTKADVVPSKKSRFSKDNVGVPGKSHQDEVLDEALEESFPASDPIAVSVTKI